MTNSFKIFIDFDGTITHEDVGASIFYEFGERDKVNLIIDDLLSGRISSIESWSRLFRTLNGIGFEKVDKFVETFVIDQSFKEFVNYAADKQDQVTILSDGFQFYIEKILAREDLSHLTFYSNTLSTNGSLFVPQFPYADEECSLCANCKRNHIINHSSDDDYTVYIGNGSSDKCPAQFCDYIFAKDELLMFCEKERITYFPFESFSDVIIKLESLRQKRRLKKRHQALLKRKEAYLQG